MVRGVPTLHPAKGSEAMAKTATRPTSRNMRLLSQHSMGGFGKCGEGLAIQITKNKRRVLWIAHASGPYSRGVHHLWFVDGQYLHMASGAADFQPRNPKDDQCYRIMDVRNPQ